MQDLDAQEIITELIQQAEENKNTEFHLITTWDEYLYYLGQERSLKVVLKVLQQCANSIFKTYCKEIPFGTADFNLLLAYNKFKDIEAYYAQELKTIKEMNAEYDNYLGSWTNFFNAIFLGQIRGD